MSLLISVLIRIPFIIDLHSRLKFQFEKFQEGVTSADELLQDTEADKNLLQTETQQLVDVFRNSTTERELAATCTDLAVRVENRANQIVHSLSSPLNPPAVFEGLQKINENILTLLIRLSANYVEMSGNSQMNKLLVQCLKKALKLIKENPPPVFEDDLEEYKNAANGIEVEYSQDVRLQQNRRIINFPGMTKFLTNLSEIEKRKNILRLTHFFNSQDAAALDPLPRTFSELLPPATPFDGLGFSSIVEARDRFVDFFKNGNWLESYIFLMLEKAGCSTKLLNAILSKDGIIIEADVLALYANNLAIFEIKDRTFCDGLSDDDKNDLTGKIEKIAQLKTPNLKINFVIAIPDDQKEDVKKIIDGIAVSKGVAVNMIFLDNQGSIDNIVPKIRMCLR